MFSNLYRCYVYILTGRMFHYRSLKELGLPVLFCLLFISSPHLQAQAEPEEQKPSDVRMVIDISGSMKKNDPHNLRRPALDMLVKLLPKGSKAGVWTFGQYVNLLVPHRVVDKKWAKKASASSQKINSVAQFTHIGAALEEAAYDHKNPSADYQKHIILLTDGMVDIDRSLEVNQKERQRIIDDILPMYQQAGFTIHTVALSDNADRQLMNKLALGTDGRASVAKNAEELMNTLLQVFDQAVPSEELPFKGNTFVTDSSIEEFTALIFRQKGSPGAQLIAPDGEKYTPASSSSRVRWHHTEKYDLITVTQPLEGEWKVLAELEPQSRITVVSDLSLVVSSIPTNLQVNDSLEVSLVLREENQTITRVEFLGLLDIDVNVVTEKGTKWSRRLSEGLAPRDGVYKTVINQFDKEGEYTLDFIVDGKSFNRKFSHELSVRKPFAVEVKQEANQGKTQFIVQVIPQSQSIDHQRTNIVGQLKKPSGDESKVFFSGTQDGNWEWSTTPDEQGEYTLSISVVAKDKEGEALSFSPEPIRLLSEQGKVAKPVEPKAGSGGLSTMEEKSMEDEGSGSMQILLYIIIGIVNILVVVAMYFAYRKLSKSKPGDQNVATVGHAGPEEEEGEGEEELIEPDMDEMMIGELDEESPMAAEDTESEAATQSAKDDDVEDSSDLDSMAVKKEEPVVELDDASEAGLDMDESEPKGNLDDIDAFEEMGDIDEETEDDILSQMLSEESDDEESSGEAESNDIPDPSLGGASSDDNK